MTVGPRILKTGIAVALALYICSLLNFEPAVFAGVAAIFTIQPSIYRTWKQISDQIITNFLGAVVALFAILFLGDSPIIIGLAVILVISLSLRMKMNTGIPLTLVTVLAIMSSPDNESILFTLNRFLIILVGISSGMLVNLLILRPTYKKNYLEKVHGIFHELSLLLRTAVSNEMKEKSFHEHSINLKKDIEKLEEEYKIFDEERGKMSKLNPLDIREIVVFKQMLKTLQQGEQVLENIDEHYFQSKTKEEEDHLFDRHIEQLIQFHEYFLLKYEGKVKVNNIQMEEQLIKEGQEFFEKILEMYSQKKDQNFRIMIIASSIVEYSFHLQRLNELIDQYYRVANRKN
ncbi:FUSC family protein [Jeotgalibacillus soli]|uniref:Aromatic acid exporter family protein n=1 Tax=Jeotgalibacillus soli TaxID=889306 RepID=A0A0C2R4T7_9BACL|nr:aromatic acid exporter family protein [Jeotgalibacillus soli]KIL45290.1 hypothetical protein KP78_28340 [Jeotgalibacillus soli]